MMISGAVRAEDAVIIDRLTHGQWLAPQCESEMYHLARVLSAFKEQLYKLAISSHSCFPMFSSFIHDGVENDVEFRGSILRHLYDANVKELGPVVIKFCPTYSPDAHRVLQNEGYAPKLYSKLAKAIGVLELAGKSPPLGE